MSLPRIPERLAITGRIESWLNDPTSRLPVSCTVVAPEDSMEGPNGIEDSWLFTSKALRNAAGVAVHLSKLRAKGTTNKHGLVSSGPVSFAQIYSKLNEVLRRGGAYKNGAVTLHLDYDHADSLEFIQADRASLPWAKRALNVDEKFMDYPHMDAVIAAMKRGDLWLVKKSYDKNGERILHNVCVSGDSIIFTTDGPQKARDLLGRQFTAVVNGKPYSSTEKGFWSNGFRQVVELTTKEGYSIKVTPDHEIHTPNGWVEAGNLQPGDKVDIGEHRPEESIQWSGVGDYDQGWLIGWLLADGTYCDEQSAKLDFYGSKSVLLNDALRRIQQLDSYIEGDGRYSKVRSGSYVEEVDRTSVTSRGVARLASEFNITRSSKTANELLELTSSEFHRGFIQAYFDADGSINKGQSSGSGKAVTVTSINLCNLQLIQRMLLRFGIRSRIWKGRYNGKNTLLPDGKGGYKEYKTKPASRLDISGQVDLQRFNEVIGLSLPEKQEKLQELLNSYGNRAAYSKKFVATVESVVPCGIEEVFDCTIDEVHEFDCNGIRVSNCLEVNLPERGTCLLAHVNLGQCNASNLVAAFTEGMKFLCELHSQTGVGESGIYLSPEQDKQVGLGVIGLANMLANEGIKYAEFVEALEAVLDGTTINSKAFELATAFKEAYQWSSKVAEQYGMVRAFAIAPTASCSYRYKDINGFTTTPEIAPPISRQVDRDSATFGVSSYDYPTNVEIAEEVGWDVFFRLNCCFQRLQNIAGLGHAISTNWWSDMVVCDEAFIERWLKSPLRSFYYSLQVMEGIQDKSQLLGDGEVDLSVLGLGDNFFPSVDEEMPSIGDLNIPCVGCAE